MIKLLQYVCKCKRIQTTYLESLLLSYRHYSFFNLVVNTLFALNTNTKIEKMYTGKLPAILNHQLEHEKLFLTFKKKIKLSAIFVNIRQRPHR